MVTSAPHVWTWTPMVPLPSKIVEASDLPFSYSSSPLLWPSPPK